MDAGNLNELRIVGGHLALDLANTVAPRPPAVAEQDFLSDLPATLAWAQRLEIVTPAESEIIDEWPGDTLAEVHHLRALVDEVLAGRELDTLKSRWAEVISRSELVPAQGVGAALIVGTAPSTMLGDRLTVALVDLLRHADLIHLRACPLDEGGCGFLFLDRSRNHSRRWCSMADCGTNVKVKRLTARRRSTNKSRRSR
ncbi:CGNR zinc finger domain-containing protein [Actinoplanes sp. NPDC026619]|uniref:CGNR zinc finger domain-containing protein n=1 Tax=Actinoplanes sp. NPDC026619 TaxID=3155798 RepID=UPI00340EF37B